MLITDHVTGDLVELRPLRYEFADVQGDEYDDNWLVIGGRARSGTDEWGFEEPAMLVSEARELADWLDAIGAGRAETVAPELDFLEPSIALSLVGSGADSCTIEVGLGLECAPPSPRSDASSILLTATPGALLSAAVALRHELSAFPGR